MRCLLPALVWVRAGTKGSSPADPGATKDKQDPHQSFFWSSPLSAYQSRDDCAFPTACLGTTRSDRSGAGHPTVLFSPVPNGTGQWKVSKNTSRREGRNCAVTRCGPAAPQLLGCLQSEQWWRELGFCVTPQKPQGRGSQYPSIAFGAGTLLGLDSSTPFPSWTVPNLVGSCLEVPACH